MDERNSFHCHYCKSFFPYLRDLDYHVDTCHDSEDSEREDMGTNMVEDVYYSSQEIDQESSDVNSVSDLDSGTDVKDNDEHDEDYVPDEKKSKSSMKVKRNKKVKSKGKRNKKVKSQSVLDARRCQVLKQVIIMFCFC